jgi:hypothetical protein
MIEKAFACRRPHKTPSRSGKAMDRIWKWSIDPGWSGQRVPRPPQRPRAKRVTAAATHGAMTRTMSSPFGSPGAGRLGGGTISFEAVRGKSGNGDRDGRGGGVRDGAATWWGRTAVSGEPGAVSGEPGAGCDGGDAGCDGGDAGCDGGDTGETRDGGGGTVTATRGCGFGLGGFGFTLGRGGPSTVQTDVADFDTCPQS